MYWNAARLEEREKGGAPQFETGREREREREAERHRDRDSRRSREREKKKTTDIN